MLIASMSRRFSDACRDLSSLLLERLVNDISDKLNRELAALEALKARRLGQFERSGQSETFKRA